MLFADPLLRAPPPPGPTLPSLMLRQAPLLSFTPFGPSGLSGSGAHLLGQLSGPLPRVLSSRMAEVPVSPLCAPGRLRVPRSRRKGPKSTAGLGGARAGTRDVWQGGMRPKRHVSSRKSPMRGPGSAPGERGAPRGQRSPEPREACGPRPLAPAPSVPLPLPLPLPGAGAGRFRCARLGARGSKRKPHTCACAGSLFGGAPWKGEPICWCHLTQRWRQKSQSFAQGARSLQAPEGSIRAQCSPDAGLRAVPAPGPPPRQPPAQLAPQGPRGQTVGPAAQPDCPG